MLRLRSLSMPRTSLEALPCMRLRWQATLGRVPPAIMTDSGFCEQAAFAGHMEVCEVLLSHGAEAFASMLFMQQLSVRVAAEGMSRLQPCQRSEINPICRFRTKPNVWSTGRVDNQQTVQSLENLAPLPCVCVAPAGPLL